MLPEIAAEALHFLSRRDFDKACAVSEWLDAMIAKCCEFYPLRRVHAVELLLREKDFALKVAVEPGVWVIQNAFSSMEETVNFGDASLLRRTYVECLTLGAEVSGNNIMTLLPDQWTAFIGAIRSGAVQRLRLERADLSALDADAFRLAATCRGLQSLEVRRSVVPSGFVTDDMIRSSAANGVLRLRIIVNARTAIQGLSDDAILAFFFRPNAAPGGQSLFLALENSGVSDTFLAKCFEQLRSSPVQPGELLLIGAAMQRGSSAYAHYLVPSSRDWADAAYRFPSIGDDKKSAYEVELYQCGLYLRVEFRLVRRPS